MFVGRTAELALLGAELRAADGGSARRALVEGPEGIGKTALVHRLLATGGARVLAASGEESEQALELGVVRQLLDEAAYLGAPVPAPAGQGPCAAGQVLRGAIDALQAQAPLVVLVDDVQWADAPSLRALSYVLRRVRAGRVLVLLACRDVTGPWLPEGLRRLLTCDGTLHVTLDGLGAADLAELISAGDDTARTAGAPGLRRAAARLREHTLGNPLHARALLAALPVRVLADPGSRLPAPGTYLRSFARRLHACAPAARALVAACAVLGEGCPLHVAAAMAGAVGGAVGGTVGGTVADTAGGAVADMAADAGAGGLDEPLDALEEAVGAGLLRELPGRLVGCAEPLARAAAYDGLGAGVRSRLHLAASRLTEDTGTALRHRAAAAGGPDEALAEELAGFAAKAAQHGQWQEAAAHLDLAAGLTESAARRDELSTAVLEHVLVGGDVIRATELAAARNADPRPVRRYVLGRLALASGRFDEAGELLAQAWRHREPGFAADVAEQLAWLRLVGGDREAAVSWARLAIEQPIAGAVARPYDVLALGGAPGAGTPPDGLAPVPGGAPGAAPPDGLALARGEAPGTAPGGLAAALAHLARGAPEQACAVLRTVVGAAAKAGLPHHRLLAAALLAVAEHRSARWDEAAARAEQALAEARTLGQQWLLPCLEVACVAPLAARGEHERALAHAMAARATARRLRHAMGERQADQALALIGTEPAGTVDGAGEVFVPDPRPGRIEALVADGRLEEAERTLALFGESGPAGQAGRLRLAGLLLAARNVPDEAEERFARALALAAGACPLEEARVLLDLGRLLRRTGRRRAAADRLGAARAIFQRLGARPLVDRCARELEACGLEPPATVRLGLTPQELSTATLAADGLTNRQIARELLISVKTVEYHLGKIYTKLGIGSRAALAAKLAAHGRPHGRPA
ncbi:AAA family ATPase [Nonomuraea sp. NPDC050153]|uniref:AAA family ATPase n=1 Tax=Nonomuraea sp. NPDC050153 TaxID=3364359 RepID=UPI003789878E